MARHTRASLAVLFFVNVLNYYDRQALGAVAEPLRREFALSDAQTRRAEHRSSSSIYAVAGLPLGRLADTWSRRKLMAIGVSRVGRSLTALGAAAASYSAARRDAPGRGNRGSGLRSGRQQLDRRAWCRRGGAHAPWPAS
jgi:MFS family permease